MRIYRFAPAGITLGAHQDPQRELDLERCERDGVRWAVRPTGGRAIFHDDEWTYAFAAPIDHPEWGGGLLEAYDRVSRVIVSSLLRLGVPASLARSGGARAGTASRAEVAAPCFTSTARHEIVVANRKLVGSAQRRTATVYLQQGSVLLGEGHLRLVDYLNLELEARERERQALTGAAVSARRWLGERAPLERWAEALRASFSVPGEPAWSGGSRSRLALEKPPSYTVSNVVPEMARLRTPGETHS